MSNLMLGIIVILYMLLIAGFGVLGYKKSKSASDFLLGGQKTNPIIMALSYGAAFISASAIVGFGGYSATFGMGIQWLCVLNMLMGVIVAFLIFGKRTRELGVKYEARTFSQLLGAHYNSRTIRIFIASVIFIGMPMYAAVVMKGGGVFIEQMFGIDLNLALLIFTIVVSAYVIAGGLKGVMYTDAMQALVILSCTIFMLVWIYQTLGMGFTEANQKLTEMAPLVPERFKELGHQGWTAMPVLGSPQWYALVTSLILGVGIGCLAQPQLVVRFMTVESSKQLNRAVIIGCVFIFFVVGSIYHVGPLSNLFFMQTEGKVAAEMTQDMDKIIPLFIDKAMPDWFAAIFMLCILSASMSTLSAQFHTMGAAFGADIFTKVGRKRNKDSSMGVRIGILVAIIISYAVCYTLSAGIIARGTALFMGICAATFLPAYFCSLYWKKATRQGALASLWVGALASLFAMLFLHKAEAAPIGLCRILFGQDVLINIYPWYMIDPILFALPLSIITIIVVSLKTKQK
ncbi:sodium:solute symporter family protein [Bacteroidales bacterium OttesenSCG-928-M11]|nr:sodium:solute symporter family protein [Bacteroidales bacterium OttesenSCG-928-M11]